MKSRLSDSASVYLEERYQDTESLTGLTHATGVNLVANERWNLGANAEIGTLTDSQTGAETDRKAGGVRVGYGFDTVQFSSAVEYRSDESQQPDLGTTERTTWLFRNNFSYQLNPDWRVVGKLNHSISDSSLGDFFDGGYTEAVFGYAYRPVANDRLNALAKYTYFYNVPTTDQVTQQAVPAEFIQKSHIAALDLTYGRVPMDDRRQVRLPPGSGQPRPRAPGVLRQLRAPAGAARRLAVPQGLGDPGGGAHAGAAGPRPEPRGHARGRLSLFGEHLKAGVGYNFTDFSDDLTDLSYDHQGAFVNVIGML